MAEQLALEQLIEVLRAHRRRHWLKGNRIPAEAYLRDHPALQANPNCAVELVYHEILLREELGETPQADEYLRRFPQLTSQLLPLFEVHQAIEKGDFLQTPPDLTAGLSTPTDRAAEPSPRLPTVPGYEILERLGQGGMGVVYKARDQNLNRAVALKMILGGAEATDTELARFRREAEAQAQLQHPNIVQIYEIGEANGRPYFALEYVEGGHLGRYLAGKLQPVRPAAQLLEVLVRAVAYAHQRGLVHRDLKPANVLLTADGTPKITDFGLAKRLQGQADLSQSGDIMGTPSYMAPEQTTGRRHVVGPPADVYALGAILYEMLTGRPPFVAETALDTWMQVRSLEPVPPRRLRPNVPRDLETICLQCLHKEPGKRYASATALADDLHRFLAGEPIRARPAGAVERLWRWGRRNPAVACLTVGMITSLLLGTGLSTYFAIQAVSSQHQAERAWQEQWANLYRANVHWAFKAWEEGDLAFFDQLMNPFRESSPVQPDVRGWEWYYLERLRQADLRTLQDHAGWSWRVAFSPDGTRLASVGEDKKMRVWDVASGTLLHTFSPHPEMLAAVIFNRGGTRLVSASRDGTICVWDAARGDNLYTLASAGRIVTVAFSPDEAQLVAACENGLVEFWDMARGTKLRTWSENLAENLTQKQGVYEMALSPDGSRLALAWWDGTVQLWDVWAGRKPRSFKRSNGDGPLTCVAFSPDGSRLAAGSKKDGKIQVWEVASGRELLQLVGHRRGVWNVPFSPDGSRLASAGEDGTVRVWDVASGQELDTHQGHVGWVGGVAFSPDGLRLASAGEDGTVRIWPTVGGQPPHRLKGSSGWHPLAMLFSRDGTRLAVTGTDGTVRRLDTVAGGELPRLKGPLGEIREVAFSEDGNRVVAVRCDGTVWLWDTVSGAAPRKVHAEGKWRIRLSPDGTHLILVDPKEGSVRLCHGASGQEERILGIKGEGMLAMDFSPDGSRLAMAFQNGTVQLWDIAGDRELAMLEGHRGAIMGVAFSPDGSRLASGDDIGKVKIWDLAKSQEMLTFGIDRGRILDVQFSPDGHRLAAACENGAVRLWDADQGQELLRLEEEDMGEVLGVQFSSDGRRLGAVGADGTVYVWDARPMTPELQVEQDAVGLLNGLFAKPLCREDVRKYLDATPTVGPLVRKKALELIDSYPEERDSEVYFRAAWAVLRQPYLNADPYRFARSQAATAYRRGPDQGRYQMTLALAQCRTGRYLEAFTNLMELSLHPPRWSFRKDDHSK